MHSSVNIHNTCLTREQVAICLLGIPDKVPFVVLGRSWNGRYKEGLGMQWFGFPGLNLYASTSEALSEVLSTSSPLKRKFGSSGPLLFLPSDDDSAAAFAQVITKMLDSESVELRQKSFLPSGTLVQTLSSLKRKKL